MVSAGCEGGEQPAAMGTIGLGGGAGGVDDGNQAVLTVIGLWRSGKNLS
jgi:hypothetical protein